GLTQMRLGRAAVAADAYRRALTLQSDNREALYGLGLAQFKSAQYEEAAKTFGQLTQSNPNDVNAWINLSSSLQRKGDETGAVAALEEAIKHSGKGARAAAAHRA